MTPEAQRIALAQAMGWTNIRTFEGYLFGVRPGEKVMMRTAACLTPSESIPVPSHVPKYLGSLDAMKSAEDTLLTGDPNDGGSDCYRYAHHLYNTCVPQNKQPCRATAPQRAEALLRTIGKWEGA